MYQLVSAIGLANTPGARWTDLNIGLMALGDLFVNYEKVYASLSNPLYQGTETLDLDSIKSMPVSPTVLFNDFLTGLGDTSLPTTGRQYSFTTKFAGHNDAIKAGYKILPISPLGHIGSTILVQDRDWLSMTKVGINYDTFYKHCLVNVNGFIHRTDTDGERIYVIDGMKTARVSNKNTVGITSFMNVGELEFVNITPDMIYHWIDDQGNEVPYKSRMYIDTSTARPTKTAMLVLGGYLHILDPKTFTQVGEKTFCINFQNFPLRDRYFDSFQEIDLTSLGLDHTTTNPVRIDAAELSSDDVLVKYATLSQSFLVFVDNDQVFVEREALPRTRIYNTYVSYVEPKYPMVVQTGKLSNYWAKEDNGQWSITNTDGRRNNYDYNTTTEENIVCIDNARTPQKPTTLSLAYFLKIGTNVLSHTGA